MPCRVIIGEYFFERRERLRRCWSLGAAAPGGSLLARHRRGSFFAARRLLAYAAMRALADFRMYGTRLPTSPKAHQQPARNDELISCAMKLKLAFSARAPTWPALVVARSSAGQVLSSRRELSDAAAFDGREAGLVMPSMRRSRQTSAADVEALVAEAAGDRALEAAAAALVEVPSCAPSVVEERTPPSPRPRTEIKAVLRFAPEAVAHRRLPLPQ